MILYKDIPGLVSDFVIDRDFVPMVKDVPMGHGWRFVDTDYFLTEYAKNWFLEKGVILKKQAALFKADANNIWGIHTDSKINDLGINFVWQGSGEMQWVELTDAEEFTIHENRVEFPGYRHATDTRVLDGWTGSCGIVNIKIPHRISTINSNIPRICFSLRPDRTKCDMTFDKLYNLF
jgi:hypothetical protein